MAKFCTHCGAPITETMKYCTNCGIQLQVPEVVEAIQEEPVDLELPKQEPVVEDTQPDLQETTVVQIVENTQALNTVSLEDTAEPIDEIRQAMMPKEKKMSSKTIGILVVAAIALLVAGLLFIPKMFTKPYEKPVTEVLDAWKDISKYEKSDYEKSLRKTIEYSVPDDLMNLVILGLAQDGETHSLDELIAETAEELYDSFEDVKNYTDFEIKNYEIKGSKKLSSDELQTAKNRYKSIMKESNIPFDFDQIKNAYRVELLLKYEAMSFSSSQKLNVITYQYKDKYYIDYLSTFYEAMDGLGLLDELENFITDSPFD